MTTIKNKKILIAFCDKFETCPRPKRLFDYLSKNNDVDILSKSTTKFDGFDNYILYKTLLSPLLLLMQKLLHYIGFIGVSSKIEGSRYKTNLNDELLSKFDLIFVHDIVLLPLFEPQFEKVIFDAREYYPKVFAENPNFLKWEGKFYDYWCRQFLKKIPLKITVSKSLAEQYDENYNAEFYSFPSYPLGCFSYSTSRSKTRKPVKLIHHGVALPDRKIEKLISLAKNLGQDFHLTLMLMNIDKDYFIKIKSSIEGATNITLLPPVPFEQIISFISQFDIGIHFLEGQKDQHPFCLPNKFFEFASAGLMLFVGGSIEMNRYVNEYNLGYGFTGVTPIDELTNRLKELSIEEIDDFKQNAIKNAPIFTFENAFPSIENLITDRLINSPKQSEPVC